MAATIKDIAKRLSISTSTVSYALNGGPRPVPEAVRRQVIEVARELRYRPNRIARSLITRRCHTIGVVPTNATPNLALTPYFQGLLNGILNTAEVLEHDVLVFTRDATKNPSAFVDTLLDGRADGLILLAPSTESPLPKMLGDEIPFLVTSDARVDAPIFQCDNADGVDQAIRHLVDLGHRKIGHLAGSSNMADGIERLGAFRRALVKYDLPLREDWIVQGDFTIDGGYRAGCDLINRPERPTAIFCANDDSALGLLRASIDSDLRVPQDLSIVGFDNSPIISASFPNITTVRQPLEEIGAAAMSALVNYVESQQRPDGVTFQTELIVRASTARPKEDDLS